jgi:polyisoprenoid-binding protein YceI
MALTAASLCNQAVASPTHYTLDPDHTIVSFEVKRLGFSRQSGEFSSVAGNVALDAETGIGSIDIAVDTRSVRAGSETEAKFLRGPSVLNVEQYSEIAYKAEHVVFVDGKPERIDGHLTLLGVTRPVSFTVVGYACPGISSSAGMRRCKLDATAVFKRSEFGMTSYMALISDEVKLAIHGVADHAE